MSTDAQIKEFVSLLTAIQITCIAKHDSVIAIFNELKILDFLKNLISKIKKVQLGALSDITEKVMNDVEIFKVILTSISELYAALFDMPLIIGDQTFLFDILEELDYSEGNQKLFGDFISQIIRHLVKSESFNFDTIRAFSEAELMKRILGWVQDNMALKNIEKASILFSLIIQLLKVC